KKLNQNQDLTTGDNSIALNTEHNSDLTVNTKANNTIDHNDQKENDVYAFQNTQVFNNTASNDNTVKPAVLKELNTDEDISNNTLYLGSLELNKNKVRGIMKKVGGIFSGKSKN